MKYNVDLQGEATIVYLSLTLPSHRELTKGYEPQDAKHPKVLASQIESLAAEFVCTLLGPGKESAA
jgi:hypothetical protein